MWVEVGCVSSSTCASSRPSGRRGGAKGGGVCGGGTEPREAPVVYAGGAKGGGEIDGLVWLWLWLQNKGNHVPIRSRLWIVVVCCWGVLAMCLMAVATHTHYAYATPAHPTHTQTQGTLVNLPVAVLERTRGL